MLTRYVDRYCLHLQIETPLCCSPSTQAQVRLHWIAWRSDLSSVNCRRSCLSCCWSKRCGMACQAMLLRPRRCRCSRTGWRHILLPPLLRQAGFSSRVVSASDCGVRGSRFESHRWQLCLSRQLLRYSLEHGLCTFTAVLTSTQPSTLRGTVKWVSAYGLSNNNNGDGGCGW